jgi:hypothetical protein
MNAVQGTGALREASFGTSVCATKAGSQECDVRVEVQIENTSLGVYRPPTSCRHVITRIPSSLVVDSGLKKR